MESNSPASSKTIVKDIFQVKVSSPGTEFASSGVQQAPISPTGCLFLPDLSCLLVLVVQAFHLLGCRCALQHSLSSGLVQSSADNVTLFFFFLCVKFTVLCTCFPSTFHRYMSRKSPAVGVGELISAVLTDSFLLLLPWVRLSFFSLMSRHDESPPHPHLRAGRAHRAPQGQRQSEALAGV